MSRSERLLAILQHLRRHRHPVSGATLAADLGISLRTLYRDIATLQAQGAYLDGAPGLGYVLREGFVLPPLMFSVDEVVAWCELRGEIRHFRTDRIAVLTALDERYPQRRQALLKAWRERECIAADRS